MAWTALETYWSTALNTAYTAGQITEPDYIEAGLLLSRWIDTEEAKDKSALASDISSYSIAGRSVQRQRVDAINRAATDARRAFMAKLYGTATYADFRQATEVGDDV